ncbi:uncharacterized protein LOC143287151 [Babylonia areolata]|uniref:uncharacterized protein LOC143287151 n=1 Tax=Babylonia areolata TaxID=304850 RepID=UPI003FCEFDE9
MPPSLVTAAKERLQGNKKLQVAVGVSLLLVLLLIIVLSITLSDDPDDSGDPLNPGDPGYGGGKGSGTGGNGPGPGGPSGPSGSGATPYPSEPGKKSECGTYYGPTGEGTCQISKSNLPPAARNSKYLGALNRPQFRGSASCGMCFRVKGDGKGKGSNPLKGDFIVFVKDLCPECVEGSMDIAIDGDGRWAIEIQAVQCPVGDTFIQYSFQGSNEWYLKLQVRNARVPPMKVEGISLAGQNVQFTLTRDGFWEGRAHFSRTEIPVRLTAITGDVVSDVIPKLENDVVMDGTKKVQFPLDPSLPNA